MASSSSSSHSPTTTTKNENNFPQQHYLTTNASTNTNNTTSFFNSNNNFLNEQKKDYGSAAAFAQEVLNWTQSARCWLIYQQMVSNSAFLAYTSLMQQQQQAAVNATFAQQQQLQNQQRGGGGGGPIRLNLTQIFRSVGVAPGVPQTIIVQQHTIPSFFRRIAAEAIDSMILFIFKLAIVFFLVEMEIVELDQFEKILSSQADLQTLIDVTQGLFSVELMCKLFAAIFEALCITFGVNGVPSGCTPGKWLLRLRVISCLDIQPVLGTPDRVAVTSLPYIDFRRSLIRSVLKNLLTTFLFPLSTAFYMFNHNRAIYDLLARTVVVSI